MTSNPKEEHRFDVLISYILIGGVLLSLFVDVSGLLLQYSNAGNFNWDYSSQWQLSGSNFFAYTVNLFQTLASNLGPMRIMALGIILLMLTPYLRVVASVLYFGRIKDAKYLLFTLFVLAVLTASLVLH